MKELTAGAPVADGIEVTGLSCAPSAADRRGCWGVRVSERVGAPCMELGAEGEPRA